MEIRPILSAMWRNKTGSVLVALQIALTLAIVVNSLFMAQNRLEHINRPSGMDIENIITVQSLGFGSDYNHDATIDKDRTCSKSQPAAQPCFRPSLTEVFPRPASPRRVLPGCRGLHRAWPVQRRRGPFRAGTGTCTRSTRCAHKPAMTIGDSSRIDEASAPRLRTMTGMPGLQPRRQEVLSAGPKPARAFAGTHDRHKRCKPGTR